MIGWLVVVFKADCLTRYLDQWVECPPWEVFLRDPSPYLCEFRKKNTENSKRLGRQARPGIESGTSRLPALSAEPRSHWWGQRRTVWTSMPYPEFEPGTFGAAAGSPCK